MSGPRRRKGESAERGSGSGDADPRVDALIAYARLSLEDEATALAALDDAWHAATDAADPDLAAALAGLAAETVGSSWGDLRPFARWRERAERAALPEEPALRIVALSGRMHIYSLFPLTDRDAPAREAADGVRVLRGAARTLPPDLLVIGAVGLLNHFAHAGESAAYEDVGTMARTACATADRRITGRYLLWHSNYLRLLDQPAAAAIAVAQCAELARSTGWYWLELQTVRAALRPAIESRDRERIETLLERNRQLLRAERPLDWGDYHHLRGWDALLREDTSAALLHYRQCIENYRIGALPPQMLGVVQGGEAAALVLMGRPAEAAAAYAAIVPIDNERGRSVHTASIELARAAHARETQAADYLDHLREGLHAMAAFELVQIFRALPRHLAQLFADALAHDIEAPFVRKAIAARKLAPPANAGVTWPWPLKVRTFGALALELRGAALESSGKAQNKPLDLVRLIASNDGRPLAVSAVIRALWADAEPEAGRRSFDAALGRLRKLVGDDDRIGVDGGRLVANESVVWFDTAELARLANRIDALALPRLPDADLRALARGLLELYGAPFLAQDVDTPWLLEARERHRNRFVRSVEALGHAFESRNLADEAIRLCERGTEVEPFAEALYRSLMLVHERRGDAAAAMRAYRRCRDMLSILGGIAPSRETATIVERLYRAGT